MRIWFIHTVTWKLLHISAFCLIVTWIGEESRIILQVKFKVIFQRVYGHSVRLWAILLWVVTDFIINGFILYLYVIVLSLTEYRISFTGISISHNVRDHRLHGSASTVLTATGQVNGRWRILTPHRIETHEPTATKFRTIDYVRGRTP